MALLVIVCPDAAALACQAAAIVAAALARKPRAVLGMAAGATPVGMYEELLKRRGRGLELSGITTFALDEYADLPPGHPASCRRSIEAHLLDALQLPATRSHWLDGRPTQDIAVYCAAYERAIADAGGIDIQLLGLGINGHIGFNEPGSAFASRTRLVALTDDTRTVNQPTFPGGEAVPEAAITMGIGTILDARRLMLLVSGKNKAKAVARSVEGPLTAMLPASALQLHDDAVVLLDEAAASLLTRRADYDAEVQVLRRRAPTLFGDMLRK